MKADTTIHRLFVFVVIIATILHLAAFFIFQRIPVFQKKTPAKKTTAIAVVLLKKTTPTKKLTSLTKHYAKTTPIVPNNTTIIPTTASIKLQPLALPREHTSKIENNLDIISAKQSLAMPSSSKNKLTHRDLAIEQLLATTPATPNNSQPQRKALTKNTPIGFHSLDDLLQLKAKAISSTKSLLTADLLFKFNSFTLQKGAEKELLKIAYILDKHPHFICQITGYSDLIGSQSSNLTISRKRAEAVANWLINVLKIPAERLQVNYFGPANPLIAKGDKKAQAINRRVEIKFRKQP